MENTNTQMSDLYITYLRVKRAIYLFLKRILDIIISLIGIVFLIPITTIIKIAYMCTGDFHRIILIQDRIGRGGKTFKFYKYRSMIPHADEALFKMLEKDKKMAEEYAINKKLKNDPRITKVGKILRKFSIDEMPQFLNVFLGDMSLIGNRPYLPREKEDMGDSFDEIVRTKPGLTGYWQVSGRSDVTFQKRLELERYYSKHSGFKMDIKIFFKTFKVVICGRGAN